jgi:ATP-dependent DNA ligase
MIADCLNYAQLADLRFRLPQLSNDQQRSFTGELSILKALAECRSCPAELHQMRRRAFEPCIPTRGSKVPSGPDRIHEIKYDGYRLVVQRDGKRVRLFTRNGHDWSDRYPLIVEAALRLSMVRPFLLELTGCQTSMACTAANIIMRCNSTPLICSSAMAMMFEGCH